MTLRNITYGLFLSVVTLAPAGTAQADPRSKSYNWNAPSSITNSSQDIGAQQEDATESHAGDRADNTYASQDSASDDYPPVDDATANPAYEDDGQGSREHDARRADAPVDKRSSDNRAANRAARDSDTPQPTIIRVQVLLDRAHFSPGEIDGKLGSNLRSAIAAYRQEHGLEESGAIDGPLLDSLNAGSGTILQKYIITDADEKGPFVGPVSEDFRKLAKLKCPCYANAREELAEKFHMSPNLLDTLNPDADLSKAGQAIVVARLTNAPLPTVSRIEVDKIAHQVRVYSDSGNVVGVFPATIGSEELPSPSGAAKVLYVKRNPVYHYDPRALHFGPKDAGAFNIAPGPNNPVGTTWIALDRPGYGIHGTPNPRLIGKTRSHGCVRLTNWDANALGLSVSPGTAVDFDGEIQPAVVASRN